jgi:AcrR family transcriptional regulator
MAARAPKRASRPLAMAPSTKEQLVLTAERLFALHGLDGVSLRQISTEAGNANNSAVQYHFGSKDQLVQAIFEYRLPALMRRRRLLMAERGSGDLRSCVEAYLLPVLEEAEDVDSHYMTFLTQLARHGVGEHPYERLPDEYKQPTVDFVRRAGAFLTGIPEPLRSLRVVQAMSICTHVSSDRQMVQRGGAPVFPYALHVAQLFDGLMGFLEAPASAATIEALPSAPEVRKWHVVVP